MNNSKGIIKFPKRKSIRLKNYDYSQNGAYFVTICTHNKKNIFSHIRRDDPCGHPLIPLTQLGEIVQNQIEFIEKRYDIAINKYVIMPNHVHLIIAIENPNGNKHPQGVSLQQIVGGYKSYISNEYLNICKEQGLFMGEIWQKGYHEHIIRNEQEYQNIWKYIDTNPLKWQDDCYHIK